MMLERRQVTRDHLKKLFKLKVAPEQDNLVAPNEITLAQQAYEPGSSVWGLWDGETLVGLLAMVDPRKTPHNEDGDDLEAAYVWRLMIGAGHQSKGYGRAAIEEALTVTRDWGLPRICLTCVDEPGSAMVFYESLGFKRTGRVISGEVELIRDV